MSPGWVRENVARRGEDLIKHHGKEASRHDLGSDGSEVDRSIGSSTARDRTGVDPQDGRAAKRLPRHPAAQSLIRPIRNRGHTRFPWVLFSRCCQRLRQPEPVARAMCGAKRSTTKGSKRQIQRGRPKSTSIRRSKIVSATTTANAQTPILAGPERPNYVTRLGRSFAFLGVLGSGLIVTTALASFGTFGRHNVGLGLVSEAAAVGVNVVVYVGVFRVLTPKAVHTRALMPGAALGGVAWTTLQAVGGYLIGHDLRNDSVEYGVFGVVLGLVAFIYLGTEITIYSAELNSALAKHLWPRGMVQPPLTKADQKSMALQATQNQRRPEQEVTVGFNEPAMTQGDWLSSQSEEADNAAAHEDAQSVGSAEWDLQLPNGSWQRFLDRCLDYSVSSEWAMS